ncbi:MAG: hypothetical protein MUP69_00740 [Candidatus Atribacteria bacterium]|nr:hypothetical protein [Candidatus Atribacteria bacterium]
MARTPLQKLCVELQRLKSMYFTARFSFEKTGKLVKNQIHKSEIDPKDPIHIKINDKNYIIAQDGYTFLRQTKCQFPRYLRETILVRLISALEVFLIEVARELFLYRRDIFYSDRQINFSQREILSINSITEIWSKVLKVELRKLQNQGFKEFVKFYDRRLGIDIGRSPVSIKIIQEMHDRRHLLIHRLGNTDEKYRRDYSERKKHISVPENYLLNSISSINDFAEFLWKQSLNVLQRVQIKKECEDLRIEEIVIEILSEGDSILINPSYHFYVEDYIISLSDILESKVVESEKSTIKLKISGPSPFIKEYMKRIKNAAKKGELILHSRRAIKFPQKKVRCRLEDSEIESIARNLPPQPWQKGIHKEIAAIKGISNTQANAVISKILDDPKLKSLIGKEYVPNNNINLDKQGGGI